MHQLRLAASFSAERYFFPVTPIEVSPIARGFFSERGLRVLVSEMLWVWIPTLTLVVASFELRGRYTSRTD
jgi:inner membrane protein